MKAEINIESKTTKIEMDSSDHWCPGSIMDRVVLALLKDLRQHADGSHPAELADTAAWHAILDKIIAGFERAVAEDDLDGIDEERLLLAKWWPSLWT